MPYDYLRNFPIPEHLLPIRLHALLEPVGDSPQLAVEVTSHYERDMHGANLEYSHMLMAVVADDNSEFMPQLDESGDGVVSFSVPVADKKGCSKDFSPSVSGHDYIVASWGNGSFYTYNLAEKVWMALGLTPRCVGNDDQRLIYDDLSLPEFGVVEGEISNEYYWSSSRNVRWAMSNEYLRKYLWMRNAYGVRAFHYESILQDGPELRGLMNGQPHVEIMTEGGWYQLDIREHKHGLLLQVWATVKAVSPELCPEQSANGVSWPDLAGPMTYARVNALIQPMHVFLNDKFLQRYEQNSFYDTTPTNVYGSWHCSPSYRGQWSFTDCIRVGRNLIRVPIRELYKAKPDREILHAHAFAMAKAEVAHYELQVEHIVSKTRRLLEQLLDLGDNFSELARIMGIQKSAIDIVGFSRAEILANGWMSYPLLSRLAQVASLDMTQQAFLSRCKSLHELWQRIPDGFLKSLLEKAGCPRASIKQFGSLRLLQGLLNIVVRLNENAESSDAFQNDMEPEGWGDRNTAMAALFINNDLRIADAHETIEDGLKALQKLGFDTANFNQGYGMALDFVMDGVIAGFASINAEVESLLAR